MKRKCKESDIVTVWCTTTAQNSTQKSKIDICYDAKLG